MKWPFSRWHYSAVRCANEEEAAYRIDLVRTGRWKSVMGPINGCQEDGNELFPIHFSHLDQNKKLVQNSYYATTIS